MRIKAIGPIKDMVNGKHYDLQDGDEVTVPDECEYWVKNGWAENVETGEKHEKTNNPVTLDIQNVKVKSQVRVK